MADAQPRNPLHGVTLEQILHALVVHFGRDARGEQASRAQS